MGPPTLDCCESYLKWTWNYSENSRKVRRSFFSLFWETSTRKVTTKRSYRPLFSKISPTYGVKSTNPLNTCKTPVLMTFSTLSSKWSHTRCSKRNVLTKCAPVWRRDFNQTQKTAYLEAISFHYFRKECLLMVSLCLSIRRGRLLELKKNWTCRTKG